MALGQRDHLRLLLLSRLLPIDDPTVRSNSRRSQGLCKYPTTTPLILVLRKLPLHHRSTRSNMVIVAPKQFNQGLYVYWLAQQMVKGAGVSESSQTQDVAG